MNKQESNPRPIQDPEGPLEQTLIADYLRTRGHDSRSVESLPQHERRRLLRDASIYAGAKLSEVEARAHLVHELHGDT
jgi:hypothetical protein